jgi:hypothetical protein
VSIIDGELDEFVKLITDKTSNKVKSLLKPFLPGYTVLVKKDNNFICYVDYQSQCEIPSLRSE